MPQPTPIPNNYILLLESDREVQARNMQLLAPRGIYLHPAFTLAEAHIIMEKAMPAAIIMETQLSDGNGLSFLRNLRKSENVPVLILSVRSDPQDVVCGLEAGADDYMTKPYHVQIFLTRVATLLRRASRVPEAINYGPIQVTTTANKAYCHGEDMNLGTKELLLLQLFIQHPGQMLASEMLYEKVWGQKMLGAEGALKVSVSKLRSKLTDAGAGYGITSSRGEGYTFEQTNE